MLKKAELCSCEQIEVSKHGLVNDEETVARVILSPTHINKKTGEIKPSAFPLSHIASKGLSLIRSDRITEDDLYGHACTIAAGIAGNVPCGVMHSKAGSLRSIKDSNKKRALCVFDDPVETNDAHATSIRSDGQDDPEVRGIRGQLLECFGQLLPFDR